MSDFAERIDALTADELRARGSLKWTRYPGAIAAWIAEMDLGLAPVIRAALDDCWTRQITGYTPQAWREEIKSATADFQAHRFGWQVDPERIYAMPGVLSQLAFVMVRWLPPDSPIVVPTPCYMPFMDMPASFGHRLVELPMIPTADGWDVNLEGLRAAFRAGAKMLVLCNPHNPIGKVYRVEELHQIADIVDHYGGLVFSDEIHAPITYAPARHQPYAGISATAAAHTVTAVAASKAFNIAGLKCAQMILTNDAHHRFCSSQGHGLPFESTPMGVAATIAAYRDGGQWLDEALNYLWGNCCRAREVFADLLPQVGIRVPQATYLLWLDARGLGLSDPAKYFANNGVVMTDGAECGTVGRGHLRFNYAMPRPLVEQAIRMMAASLGDKT